MQGLIRVVHISRTYFNQEQTWNEKDILGRNKLNNIMVGRGYKEKVKQKKTKETMEGKVDKYYENF